MRLRLLTLLAVAPVLAIALAGPAHAAGRSLPWSTCQPLATWHDNSAPGYRVDDGGATVPLCIETTTGHNVLVKGDYQGTGVAYPAVRVGSYDLSRDPYSRLPVQVSDPTWISLRLRSDCTAPGSWLADVDGWFYPTSYIHGHGVAELVIVTCSHDWDGACPRMLRAGSRRYCADTHLTGPPGHQWPLIILRLARQQRHVRIALGRVMRALTAWRWLTPDLWLGSVFYGGELQHGAGRGLRMSMTAYVQGYPTLQHPPGGTS